MRKLCFLLAAVALMCSCRGRNGKDGVDGAISNRRIVDVLIKSAEWSYTNAPDNNFYFAEIDLPEMTKEAYDNGDVQVYQEFYTSAGERTQVLIPSSRHYEVKEGSNTFFYTQTTDYEYWVSGMKFYITNSDFIYNPTDLTEPGDRHYRIIILY